MFAEEEKELKEIEELRESARKIDIQAQQGQVGLGGEQEEAVSPPIIKRSRVSAPRGRGNTRGRGGASRGRGRTRGRGRGPSRPPGRPAASKKPSRNDPNDISVESAFGVQETPKNEVISEQEMAESLKDTQNSQIVENIGLEMGLDGVGMGMNEADNIEDNSTIEQMSGEIPLQGEQLQENVVEASKEPEIEPVIQQEKEENNQQIIQEEEKVEKKAAPSVKRPSPPSRRQPSQARGGRRPPSTRKNGPRAPSRPKKVINKVQVVEKNEEIQINCQETQPEDQDEQLGGDMGLEGGLSMGESDSNLSNATPAQPSIEMGGLDSGITGVTDDDQVIQEVITEQVIQEQQVDIGESEVQVPLELIEEPQNLQMNIKTEKIEIKNEDENVIITQETSTITTSEVVKVENNTHQLQEQQYYQQQQQNIPIVQDTHNVQLQASNTTNEIENLKNLILSLKTENSSLRTQLSTSESNMATLSAQIEQQNTLIEDLKTQNIVLTKKSQESQKLKLIAEDQYNMTHIQMETLTKNRLQISDSIKSFVDSEKESFSTWQTNILKVTNQEKQNSQLWQQVSSQIQDVSQSLATQSTNGAQDSGKSDKNIAKTLKILEKIEILEISDEILEIGNQIGTKQNDVKTSNIMEQMLEEVSQIREFSVEELEDLPELEFENSEIDNLIENAESTLKKSLNNAGQGSSSSSVNSKRKLALAKMRKSKKNPKKPKKIATNSSNSSKIKEKIEQNKSKISDLENQELKQEEEGGDIDQVEAIQPDNLDEYLSSEIVESGLQGDITTPDLGIPEDILTEGVPEVEELSEAQVPIIKARVRPPPPKKPRKRTVPVFNRGPQAKIETQPEVQEDPQHQEEAQEIDLQQQEVEQLEEETLPIQGDTLNDDTLMQEELEGQALVQSDSEGHILPEEGVSNQPLDQGLMEGDLFADYQNKEDDQSENLSMASGMTHLTNNLAMSPVRRGGPALRNQNPDDNKIMKKNLPNFIDSKSKKQINIKKMEGSDIFSASATKPESNDQNLQQSSQQQQQQSREDEVGEQQEDDNDDDDLGIELDEGDDILGGAWGSSTVGTADNQPLQFAQLGEPEQEEEEEEKMYDDDEDLGGWGTSSVTESNPLSSTLNDTQSDAGIWNLPVPSSKPKTKKSKKKVITGGLSTFNFDNPSQQGKIIVETVLITPQPILTPSTNPLPP